MAERLDIMPDELHMDAGRALAAGKLTLTVRSKLTDQHITLRMVAKAKVADRWRTMPFHLAQRVYIDVPSEWGDSVATYHVTGEDHGLLIPAQGADSSRYWCALYALRWACGRDVSYAPNAEVVLSTWCMRCGQELTEPESVEANMGPHCRKVVSEAYGTRHQEKHLVETERPVPERKPVVMEAPPGMVKQPGETLEAFLERIEQ